jgi:hypothetical protein
MKLMDKKTFKAVFGVWTFVFLGASAYFFFTPVLADDYDVYVDKDFDEEEQDGSSDKPFNSIKKAIKESKEENFEDIFIKEGVYEEDLDLIDSVKLIGEDKNEVVIKGKIIMEDDNELENLTVKNNIIIKGDADVEIKNCKIIDFSGIGIEALKGDGKVEVRNCEISGKGKGFYIMRGREIEIENNDIHNNIGEEAVDLRAELSGFVKDNKIYNNGESGIEVIVGGADLEIIGNDIEDNGSSAIAVQFYPDWSDEGKIVIKNNTLEDSDNYGIDCKRTQGGSGGSDYFYNSLKLSDNKIQDNKKGGIADFCGIKQNKKEEKEESSSRQFDAKKEGDAKQTSQREGGDLEKKEIEKKARQQEEQKKEREMLQEKRMEKERIDAKLEEVRLQKETDINIFNQKRNLIESRGSIKTFFLGVNQKALKEVQEVKKTLEGKLEKMQDLEKQIKFKENKEEIISERENLEKEIKSQETFIESQRDNFSLFGWIVKWFS